MSDYPQAGSRKAWYLLHSWSGIVLALLIYIVCASGCVALFAAELQLWQYPQLQRVAPATAGVNVAAMVSEARRAQLVTDNASFRLPHHTNAAILRVPDGSERIAFFNPDSGTLLGVEAEGFGRTLRGLHADLLLPFPVGAFLVGFLGITLLFLAVTGIGTHRRFYSEIFTLRTGRSWRLSWSDVHKLAGTWAVVFLGMMGFTGSILGLAGLLLVQTAVVAHGGNAANAYAELGSEAAAPAGIAAPLGPTGPMLARDINGQPFIPRFITIHNIGDANATVTVEGERPGQLSESDRKVYSRDGRLLATERGVDNGAGWRVYSALMPLHFGTYADAALKFVYLLLGLAACLMPVSGILLWLDRHRRDNTLARSHVLMRALSTGLIIGFPIAVGALFLLARLAPGWMALQGKPGLALVAVWLAAIAWSLLQAAKAGLESQLLGLTGMLFLLIAPVNGWVTGDFFLFALAQPLHTSHVVDAVMAAFGLSFLAARWRLRQT